MKKKHLKSLAFKKVSISDLQSNFGGRPYTTDYPQLPEEPRVEETMARMCPTGVITTSCPTAIC
ncbi:hypothetical protein [Ascidiimonas aurantiaca]|uniref:hypothetical protein n=1 Tax=Ascidiimonas aurantiaca TaxID=1685432 RepID=UPI0030EF82B5